MDGFAWCGCHVKRLLRPSRVLRRVNRGLLRKLGKSMAVTLREGPWGVVRMLRFFFVAASIR